MDDEAENLAVLDQRAREQRQRLLEGVNILRERLRPSNLAQEAGNRVLDIGLDTVAKAKETVRAHPIRAFGLAALAGVLLARRPLIQMIRLGYARWRGWKTNSDEAPEKHEG